VNANWAILHAALGGAFGRNRGRLVLSVVVVALGVALGFAVALINEAAVAEFTKTLGSPTKCADPAASTKRCSYARARSEIAVASPMNRRVAGDIAARLRRRRLSCGGLRARRPTIR
jgi:hypothetical protein